MEWSKQQLAIFEWFRDGEGHLVVRARAGTGKTSTSIEAINHAPEEKILLCAFNKEIQEELQRRLSRRGAEAKTLNALGFRFVRDQLGGNLNLDTIARARQIAYGAMGASAKALPFEQLKLVGDICYKVREIAPHADTLPEVVEVAARFDLLLGDDDIDTELCRHALQCVRFACSPEGRSAGVIDFADQIFLPLRCDWVRPLYDMVVVDEAQDMSAAQLELAQKSCRKGGRIVVVGDDRQCQPPGTIVRVPGGRGVPIETLRNGDHVVAWDRHGQALVGREEKLYPVKVARRVYKGDMLTVHAKTAKTRCTPDHLWAVKYGARKMADRWVVYLMRRGDDFRIGWCQLFDRSGALHLGQRARLEKADAAWVLSEHASKAEASLYESFCSVLYQIPMTQFEQSVASPQATLITQAYLDEFWSRMRGVVNLPGLASACLAAHGRLIACPFYRVEAGVRKGRSTVVELHACNLLDGMQVPVAAGKRVVWETIQLSRAKYNGFVYSLEVAKHPYYVADGIVTHNCIYGFRGAAEAGLDEMKAQLNAKELGLTITYRCPKSVVALAAEIVPDFTAADSAPEGEVKDVEVGEIYNAQPGDFIVSRTNAPLAKLCLGLLARGTRAKIRGRDIGTGVRKLLKRAKASNVKQLLTWIESYTEREQRKLARCVDDGALTERQAETKGEQLHDQGELIRALCIEAEDLQEVEARCDELFTDHAGPAVLLSTTHKIKGLEAARVWMLTDTYAPHPKHGESTEGANLRYVAITRAKETLFRVPKIGARFRSDHHDESAGV